MRTKMYLKNALIELLDTVPFENITIKAICQKASVNRSTFYAYYSCPRDLIEEIESDIISKLPEYTPGGARPFLESIIPFMQYVKENGKTFRIFLSTPADASFGERLITAVMDKYEEFSFIDGEDERIMGFIFCVNGVVGVVREWINSGFRLSVDSVSRLIVEMAFRAVGMIPDRASSR